MSVFSFIHKDTIIAALHEDIGYGDITSDSTIPYGTAGKAVMRAREPGILAGRKIVYMVYSQLCSRIDIDFITPEGGRIEAGDEILSLTGPAQVILAGERVMLNFLSHLCGIASETAKYVDLVKHTNANITCTRKTLPGLRAAQKYAVRMGGGKNHRFGLDDAVLIKDNHIAVAGGIKNALADVKKKAGHMVKVEIEVDTLDQLKDVLDLGTADIVMLDNFNLDDLRKGVEIVDGRMLIEASGGVNLDTVKDIAETGVDLISVGALTHSVKALDIGLDIDL